MLGKSKGIGMCFHNDFDVGGIAAPHAALDRYI